jgi:hypothetical protein
VSVRFLSENPGKRAVERFTLFYTPVWGAVLGVVMTTGVAESWGDLELMLLGLALFAGAAVGPFLWPAREDRGLRLHRRYAFKIVLWVTLFSFLANYFGTAYFYEVLHAHYGFATRIHLNDVPLFLYFTTVAYFSTYVVLLNIGWRVGKTLLRPRSRLLFALFCACLPYVVAGLESALNANPWMGALYCFDDLPFALWFGTLSYGTWLVIVMPFLITLDETPDGSASLRRVASSALASTMLILCANEVLARAVAPHVTHVAVGHVGLRDYGESCLAGPPR